MVFRVFEHGRSMGGRGAESQKPLQWSRYTSGKGRGPSSPIQGPGCWAQFSPSDQGQRGFGSLLEPAVFNWPLSPVKNLPMGSPTVGHLMVPGARGSPVRAAGIALPSHLKVI